MTLADEYHEDILTLQRELETAEQLNTYLLAALYELVSQRDRLRLQLAEDDSKAAD